MTFFILKDAYQNQCKQQILMIQTDTLHGNKGVQTILVTLSPYLFARKWLYYSLLENKNKKKKRSWMNCFILFFYFWFFIHHNQQKGCFPLLFYILKMSLILVVASVIHLFFFFLYSNQIHEMGFEPWSTDIKEQDGSRAFQLQAQLLLKPDGPFTYFNQVAER